jgi:hypothetical protein
MLCGSQSLDGEARQHHCQRAFVSRITMGLAAAVTAAAFLVELLEYAT